MEKWAVISSIGVVFLSVWFGWMNYPPPPISPIVYQWKSWGDFYRFDKFNVFYMNKIINEPVSNTLLCLHGFPTSSFDYFKLLPHFRKIFDRVVFIDFLGMGFSDKPADHRYSIFEQSDIVEGIIKHLGITQLHILAHDYGDTVTQEILARFKEGKIPFQIKSVTLMNGGIIPGVYSPLIVQRALRWPIVSSLLNKIVNRHFFGSVLNRVFGTLSLTHTEIADFWHIVREKNGYKIFGEILAYMEERHDNEERWVSSLKSTKIPIQFIYGPADPVNPPPFDAMYHKLIPNPYLDRLSDSIGHYPHYEAPEEVFRRLDQFLQKMNTTGRL